LDVLVEDTQTGVVKRKSGEKKPKAKVIRGKRPAAKPAKRPPMVHETGRSMPQVALAWLRQRSVPVIPILGARKLSQLQDNLASLELTLSAGHVKSLDEASAIELGFPHYLYNKEMTRGLAYGGMRDRLLV
jgi:aryl-alcohol dehydrogenase-like predicted oxidoreductase